MAQISCIAVRAQDLARLAASHEEWERKEAFRRIVTLSATELVLFAHEVSRLRGWGSGLRKAVESWYAARTPTEILVDTEGARKAHAELIRMCHPKPVTPMHSLVFQRLTNTLLFEEVA